MNDVYAEVAREDIIMQENRTGIGSDQSISCGNGRSCACGSTCSNENCRTKQGLRGNEATSVIYDEISIEEKLQENEVSEVVDEDLEWMSGEEIGGMLFQAAQEMKRGEAERVHYVSTTIPDIATELRHLIRNMIKIIATAEEALERLEKHEDQ